MESSQCVNCQENFNLSHKQRIMIPCGDSICLQCFDIFLQPQNELECMKCGKTSDITIRYKQKVSEIKESIQTVGVFCDTHPNILAEKYCSQHQVMICSNCAFESHHSHPQLVKDVKRKDIQGFCDNAVYQLITLKDRITSLVDRLDTYKNNDKGLASNFLMAAVKEAQEILTTSFLKTDQEQQNLSFLTENSDPKNIVEMKQLSNTFVPTSLKKEEVKETIQPIPKQKQPAYSSQAFETDFTEQSRQTFKITPEEHVLLQQWIGRPVKFKLTYRGTQDGFNYNGYIDKCKGIKSILILIKSEHNQVFGGFTSIKCNGHQVWFSNPQAFIFSLTKKTKHSQYKKQDQAICFWDNQIIQFGYKDICIYNDCDQNSDSSSNIGGTYKPIGEHIQGSDESKTYLAGSYKFKVIEIEAYQII